MTKWLLCGKILQDLTKGDKNMGVPTFVICFLIAGVVLFLIFTTAFVIESVSKNNDTNNIAVSNKKDEDLDIDAMLSDIESIANKMETDLTLKNNILNLLNDTKLSVAIDYGTGNGGN